jgi:hypothetical protein
VDDLVSAVLSRKTPLYRCNLHRPHPASLPEGVSSNEHVVPQRGGG